MTSHKQRTATLRTTTLTAKDIPAGLRMQTGGEWKLGRALLDGLRREFPHDLPIPRLGWGLLALVEFAFCSGCFWMMAMLTMLNVVCVRGHMEYSCGFYAWLAFGAGWLYPVALLMTPWKRSFAAARYLLLGLGGLCLVASAVNLLAWWWNPAPILAPVNIFGGIGGEVAPHMTIIPLLLLGGECLLRFCCGRYYRHCFYLAALMSSYQTNRRAFLSLVALLLVHAAVLIAYFGW